jgi:exopolysaccharide biosynthesis polyprenyl glycosylphosphotransferase
MSEFRFGLRYVKIRLNLRIRLALSPKNCILRESLMKREAVHDLSSSSGWRGPGPWISDHLDCNPFRSRAAAVAGVQEEFTLMTTLFGHSVRWELLFLCAIEAITWFCAFAFLLTWGAAGDPNTVLVSAAAMALCCMVVSGATGLYQPEVWARARRLLVRTAVAGALLLAAWPLLRAAGPDALGPFGVELLLGFATTVVATRLAISSASRNGLLRQRIVAVRPADGEARRMAPIGRGDPKAADGGVEVVAAFTSVAQLAAEVNAGELRARGVHTVVVPNLAELPASFRTHAARYGVRVLSDGEFREELLSRVDIEALPAGWVDRARAVRVGPIEQGLHRLLDLGAGVVLLTLTLPLLLLTALAIKLDTKGPVLYRQERIGQGGRRFMLIKFRSMRVDAEAAGRPLWASQHDPRVTRVGRIIRRTRIDEIPQVFNVLSGDMAFVGPRPERPAFVEELRALIPNYDVRAVVKPGITGWAQVNYPYGASVEDARMKLSYDLYYIRRRSLFLDLLILMATVRVVLFQEGSR